MGTNRTDVTAPWLLDGDRLMDWLEQFAAPRRLSAAGVYEKINSGHFDAQPPASVPVETIRDRIAASCNVGDYAALADDLEAICARAEQAGRKT